MVFRKKPEEEDQYKGRDQSITARRVYIRAADLSAFGHTRGCPRCEHELVYGPNRCGKPHSDTCRSRIMGELAKTEAGRLRIGAATDRLDKTVADMGERLMGQGEMRATAEVPHQAQEAPQAFVPMQENSENPVQRDIEPAEDMEATGGYDRVAMGDLDLEDGGDLRDDSAPMGDDMDGGMEISAVRASDENITQIGSVGSKLSSTDETAVPSHFKHQDRPEQRDGSKPSATEPEEISEDHELRDLLKLWTKDAQVEAKRHCQEILQLVKSLGGDGPDTKGNAGRASRQ